jgi:predicted HTH domain antitoxin
MRKEELVAARLPETLVSDIKKIEDIEQTDRLTVLRKLLDKAVTDWKREYAAKRYADGSITLERAAMDAKVSVREMMDYLRQKKIATQYSSEDLEDLSRRSKNSKESNISNQPFPHGSDGIRQSC